MLQMVTTLECVGLHVLTTPRRMIMIANTSAPTQEQRAGRRKSRDKIRLEKYTESKSHHHELPFYNLRNTVFHETINIHQRLKTEPQQIRAKLQEMEVMYADAVNLIINKDENFDQLPTKHLLKPSNYNTPEDEVTISKLQHEIKGIYLYSIILNAFKPGDSYKTITHELGRTPDFVVVQLKMTNGYVSEATGVTFSSQSFHHQTVCGTVFAFNDQEIRLWSMSGTSSTPCNGTERCSPDWPRSRCISTDCPIPPDIGNAYKLYEGLTNGSKALYSCKTGYTESSDDVIINCVDGTWSMTSMFCKAVCTSPPAIENAAVFVQDNRAKYYCLTGYFAIENTVDIIECSNRIWPSPDFKCIKSCPDPPSITNANVMVSNNVALYSCLEGFLPKSGTSSIKCLLSEWQTTNFSCYAVCSSPPAIENAAVFVQDNRAKYYCLTGYFAIENTVDIIECRNRIWPSPDFKCIKSCPDPPSIANANVMVSNNVALYSCHEGFLPKSGTSSIKCLQSEWQTTNFSCYAVCSSPPAIENAAVFVQGNRAKYCCLTGYFAIENTVDIIECSNRIWPSPDFKCLKSCPDPPSIANANVMVSNNVALYSCHEGFLPKSGTSSIKCLQSEWQTTNFSCYASSCGPLPNITNADFLVDNDVAMYACRYGFRPTNSDNKVTCVSGEWTYTSLKCQDTSNRQRSYVTNETLEEWIKKMKEDLYVNKSKTSVYNRSLISVYESRPSAVQLGSVGVFLISFMITALILPDIIALVKKVCHKLNKTFCYRRINQ
ncbi:sushi, von Willebrand factor type A, EGF and pentraxin domain-containing protein 1-like [Saccostrea echinata]|uniref:sushi, von Willebrand factor type A, EGF and pentraxin domain-containing protein 1-like n=1 Tax=Saccostrea echinata TaxID=191078 RepID=UPI002A80CA98|nr:sushi, von Willebrand factor type A, EGF and pentraxin domain-containing protein 1-like [Saccostrea echinata]